MDPAQPGGGIGVHIAARVRALANPGEIPGSRTAGDLAVGSKLEFIAGLPRARTRQ